MEDKVTLIVPASVPLSAPSTRLIENAIGSAERMFLQGKRVRCIVHCDIWDESVTSREYLKNLKALAETRGWELVTGSRGLSCAMLLMMDMVETEYYFFLEHDWEFVRPVELASLVSVMDSHPEVNYVRFNKRRNAIYGHDRIMEPFIVDGVPLLKNNNWSNNPHIGRTRMFREWWGRYLPSEPSQSIESEVYILHKYEEDIEKYGFEKAWLDWGVCVYGRIGEPKIVMHLDGNKWRGKGIRAALDRRKRLWLSHR